MRFRGTLSNREITRIRFIQRNNVHHVYHVHGKNCIRGRQFLLQLQVATSSPCTCTLSILFADEGGRGVRTNGTHVHAFANSMQQGLQEGKRERLPEWKSSTNRCYPRVFFPTAYSKCIRIVSHARGTLPVQFNFPRFDRLILYRLSLRNQIIFRWNTRGVRSVLFRLLFEFFFFRINSF